MPEAARRAGRELLSRTAALFTLALVCTLALTLPAAAGAQVLDPTLDQYAPSAQQIHDQVNGGHGGGQGLQGGGAGGGGGQASQGESGQVPQGGGGQAPQGGQVPQGGGGQVSPAGDGGQADQDAAGGQVDRGDGGAGTPARAEGNGLADRVVGGVPLTGFDLVALALAVLAIAGTAVLLRRLSRRPEAEA